MGDSVQLCLLEKSKFLGLFFWPVSLLFPHGAVKPREVSVRNWGHYVLNTATLNSKKATLDRSTSLSNMRHRHRESHKIFLEALVLPLGRTRWEDFLVKKHSTHCNNTQESTLNCSVRTIIASQANPVSSNTLQLGTGRTSSPFMCSVQHCATSGPHSPIPAVLHQGLFAAMSLLHPEPHIGKKKK